VLGAPQLLDLILADARRGRARVASFVGAGGKTEAIFALAIEARTRGLAVVVTTTTAMRDPRSETDRPVDLYLDESPRTALPRPSLAFLGSSSGNDEKVSGLPVEEIARMVQHCDLILVEADGSRGLPIKAPAAHEPVIPPESDVVLACVGFDALGRPADATTVHRLPEFLSVTGLAPGDHIDAKAIFRLAEDPKGSFKGCPSEARRFLLLCKADASPRETIAVVEDELDRLSEGTKAIAVSLGARRLGRIAASMAVQFPRRSDTVRNFVLVRGAGDLATGVMVRLWNAGYRVGALECAAPSAIRRSVAFSEAIYADRATVEGIAARRVADVREMLAVIDGGAELPLLIDPEGASIKELRPLVLVDAIMAKRNLGTSSSMAPFVIALGPGFAAGADAHALIETNRGHDLGRIIRSGEAQPDTGQPGEIGGASAERVIRAEVKGLFKPLEAIGDIVRQGQLIAYVENNNDRCNVYSKINGVLRGILPDSYAVTPGFKIADVDPRAAREHCFRVSDKSRAIGGGVLEAILARGIFPSVSRRVSA